MFGSFRGNGVLGVEVEEGLQKGKGELVDGCEWEEGCYLNCFP